MIVSGGEALVDLVPAGSTAPATDSADPTVRPSHLADPTIRPSHLYAPRLGGGPYNVALAAARLGVPTGFFSRVSTDRFGDALLARLAASGVDTSLTQRGPEPTTLAVVSLDDDAHASYTFYTEGTADRLVTDPGPLPPEVTALSVGTLGMVLEPGASAYEAVLRRAAARGVLTALDPNIRAALIADPEAYRARFRSWLPDVRLLKLSADDAAWLAGGGDVTSAVGSWLDEGVGAVVLTSGSAGLSAYTVAGEMAAVPVVPVAVADTIGAGDTVQGALLAWLAQRDVTDPTALDAADWREALGFAARAAACTVSRSGAEPPTADEVAERA